MAGQLARLIGARKVIGSAGSAEKVAWLTDELGFDAAFDYQRRPGRQAAGGRTRRIDVYFDNVGGDHLEAAIFHCADTAGSRRAARSPATTDRRCPGPAT